MRRRMSSPTAPAQERVLKSPIDTRVIRAKRSAHGRPVRWLRRRNGPPRGSENFTNFHFFHPQKRCGSLDGVSFLTNNYIYYPCWVRRRMSSPTAPAQEFITKRVLKIPIDTRVIRAQWVICVPAAFLGCGSCFGLVSSQVGMARNLSMTMEFLAICGLSINVRKSPGFLLSPGSDSLVARGGHSHIPWCAHWSLDQYVAINQGGSQKAGGLVQKDQHSSVEATSEGYHSHGTRGSQT